jgi:HlyD family secretion protein
MQNLSKISKKALSRLVVSSEITQSKLDELNSIHNSVSSTMSTINTTIINSLQASNNSRDTNKQGIASARSSLKNKEISLNQAIISYQELLNPVRSVDLAASKANLQSASINIDRAKYNLSKAEMLSPINGEVALLNYSTGDVILRDDTKPVAVIINNDSLYAEVNIEESEIGKIQVGQLANITLQAIPDFSFPGEISFISLVSNVDSTGIVTYMVRVTFENPEQINIREGMSAEIEFVLEEKENILLVPRSAIQRSRTGSTITTLSGNIIDIETGITDGKYFEVKSGPQEGDIIVY